MNAIRARVSLISDFLQRVGYISLITASRCINRRFLSPKSYPGPFPSFSAPRLGYSPTVDEERYTNRFDIPWHQASDDARSFLQLLDSFRRVNLATLEFHWNGNETLPFCVNGKEDKVTLRFHGSIGWKRKIYI